MSEKENRFSVFTDRHLNSNNENDIATIKESAKDNRKNVTMKQQKTDSKANVQHTKTFTEKTKVSTIKYEDKKTFEQLNKSPSPSPSPSAAPIITNKIKSSPSSFIVSTVIEKERRSASPTLTTERPIQLETYKEEYHIHHSHLKAIAANKVLAAVQKDKDETKLKEEIVDKKKTLSQLEKENETKQKENKSEQDKLKQLKKDVITLDHELQEKQAIIIRISKIQEEITENNGNHQYLLDIICELNEQGLKHQEIMCDLEDQIQMALNQLSETNFKISELLGSSSS